MIYIGCHLSVTKGYEAMGKTMSRYGGSTFSWFTRNPRGGKAKAIETDDADSLNEYIDTNKFGPLVAHGSYTMNLCAANPVIRENSMNMFEDDMKRMAYFPGNFYNFHPGAHVGQGAEKGIELISDALNEYLTEDMKITVLLETMAGKGSEVGSTFEELKEIIDRVELKDKLGVCFDTCHTWDSGYDIVSDLDGVLSHFDDIIGLDRLKAVHLNDSKNDRGSHKDRHEKIGEGYIGLDAMKRIVTHPVLQDYPFILETPNDEDGYIREIAMIKGFFTN